MGGKLQGDPAIEFRGCAYVYPQGRTVIRDFDWRVGPGTFSVLSGPTGCGKSTVLRLVLRLLKPSAGTISVLGEDLQRLPGWQRPRLRRRIGVVAQDLALLNDRTVEQNLYLALAVQGKRGGAARRRVAQLLQEGMLMHRRHDYPIHLSGGERQRLAVARAASGFPDLVLADEPTAHLDDENAAAVIDWLYRLQTSGSTVVAVTHSPERFKASFVERYRLEGGRLRES